MISCVIKSKSIFCQVITIQNDSNEWWSKKDLTQQRNTRKHEHLVPADESHIKPTGRQEKKEGTLNHCGTFET